MSPAVGDLGDPAKRSGVEVAFAVHAETAFGDKVYVVGGADGLGEWRPCSAVELYTDSESYPHWSGAAWLPAPGCAAVEAEYKFFILHSSGAVEWEPGPNRRLASSPAKQLELFPPPLLLFGDTAAAAPKAALWPHDAGVVRRQDSTTSTAVENEDDSPDLTPLTSACTSSVCLFPIDPLGAPEAAADEGPPAAPADRLRLWPGARRLEKPGGPCEDSYFFGAHSLGVADGVGQMTEFADQGVDVAAYAAELMDLAARALGPAGAERPSGAEGPASASAAAAIDAAERGAETFGASTVTVLALEGTTAGVANLGDSGFMILRPTPWGMEVAHSSREQTHGWNCPYQLTRVPEGLAHRAKGLVLDSSASCDRYDLTVQPGDLILMFTDGMTDNLHWYDIVRVVNDALEPAADLARPTTLPERVAEALALAARDVSLDTSVETPFARNARRHRQLFQGGKTDDITVVAAWVLGQTTELVAADSIMVGCARDADKSRTVVLEPPASS